MISAIGFNPVIAAPMAAPRIACSEIMFSDFIAVCFDYIANEFPKSRYMSNGQVKCPLVVRTGNGAGSRFGAQHSQSVENWCMMIPGLKVVAPSNPRDVIGLMRGKGGSMHLTSVEHGVMGSYAIIGAHLPIACGAAWRAQAAAPR